jgi:hypothetical protein
MSCIVWYPIVAPIVVTPPYLVPGCLKKNCGSLIDRSIDLLLTFLKICLAAHAIAH